MSKVIITLKPGQPAKVEAQGAPGGDCRLATGPYLQVLPGRTVSDTPTAEAQLPAVSQSIQQQVRGN